MTLSLSLAAWTTPALAADQPNNPRGGQAAARRAEASKGETYLDPEKAGLEYKLQGEYVGPSGGSKLGAQVIALGGNKFHVVFEPGGLPGEGWDGKKVEVDGQGEGEKTTFEGKG